MLSRSMLMLGRIRQLDNGVQSLDSLGVKEEKDVPKENVDTNDILKNARTMKEIVDFEYEQRKAGGMVTCRVCERALLHRMLQYLGPHAPCRHHGHSPEEPQEALGQEDAVVKQPQSSNNWSERRCAGADVVTIVLAIIAKLSSSWQFQLTLS